MNVRWGWSAKNRGWKGKSRPVRFSPKAVSLLPLFGIGMLLGAAVLFARLSVEEVANARNQLHRVAEIYPGSNVLDEHAGAVNSGANAAGGKASQPSNQGQAGADGQSAPNNIVQGTANGGASGQDGAQGDGTETGVNDGEGNVSVTGVNEEEGIDSVNAINTGKPDGLLNGWAEPEVRVLLTKEQRVETVPLETYVLGVLAGEMPAEFELEALKAQAIAARTYIIRKLAQQQERSDTVTAGADVTDTVADQVYVPKAELAQKWADAAVQKANLAKLKRAVGETEGLVITYEGEPIQASFFSTSNGYTENSEDYWDQSLPYLRSVDSPWDIGISPRYKETVIFTREELYSKLGITGKPAEKKLSMKVLDKTEGNRVKTVRINGVEFSGREFRERLGLASSQFSWKIDKQEIAVTTYGYGHGVGMSQWGANGMALEGKRAVQILRHYYTGTKVEQASKLSK